MADSMPKGEEGKMSSENFLEEMKKQYYSEQDLLEIKNEFQNLKKRRLNVNKYVAYFTEKMKFVRYLVPTELSKVNKFASGLLADFDPMVKLANTLKAAIWTAWNVEI